MTVFIVFFTVKKTKPCWKKNKKKSRDDREDLVRKADTRKSFSEADTKGWNSELNKSMEMIENPVHKNILSQTETGQEEKSARKIKIEDSTVLWMN